MKNKILFTMSMVLLLIASSFVTLTYAIPKQPCIGAICDTIESEKQDKLAINVANSSNKNITIKIKASEDTSIDSSFTIPSNIKFTDNLYFYINLKPGQKIGNVVISYYDPILKKDMTITTNQCYIKVKPDPEPPMPEVTPETEVPELG